MFVSCVRVRRLWRAASLAALASVFASVGVAAPLLGPPGLTWGMTPQQVVAAYYKKYEFHQVEAPSVENPKVIHDQKFVGRFLDMHPAHIRPIFYLGKLFSMSVYYPPQVGWPASKIWEEVVANLQRLYGPPSYTNRPKQLTTTSATVTHYPIEQDPDARYRLMDLQIQTGAWIPNAEWRFDNGSFINAVIHGGPPDANGMRVIMPLVIYNKHDILHFLRPAETRWRR